MGIYDEENYMPEHKTEGWKQVRFDPSQLSGRASLMAVEEAFKEGLTAGDVESRGRVLTQWMASVDAFLTEGDPGKQRRLADRELTPLLDQMETRLRQAFERAQAGKTSPVVSR